MSSDGEKTYKSRTRGIEVCLGIITVVVLLAAGAGIGIGIYLGATRGTTKAVTDGNIGGTAEETNRETDDIQKTSPTTVPIGGGDTQDIDSPFRATRKPLVDPTVIVIGAGMSGLSASQTLLEGGVKKVTVLEASDRIGGRVWSVPFHGHTVEIGAHWVQGKGESPIWKLAQKVKLEGDEAMYDDYVFRNNTGHDITDEADELYERFDPIVEAVEELSSVWHRNGLDDLDLRSTLRFLGWRPQTPLEHAVEYYEYDFETAQPLDLTSVKYYQSSNPGNVERGDDYFVNDPRGFEAVIKEVEREVRQYPNSEILKNQWVNKVEYDGHTCSVRTKDGNTYTADFCISTVSLGVLQREVIQFIPSLPYWKRKAIHKHQMGNYASIYIKFPDNTTRFWDDSHYFVYVGPSKGRWVIWLNYEADGLLPEGSNILMATAVGDELKRLLKMTKEELIQDFMEVLHEMYGPSIPDATDVLLPDFVENPLFYGSFSDIPSSMQESDIRAFRSNVNRLYFSGEACSFFYYGYLHGAYLEGVDTANQILKCIRGGKCNDFPLN